jgi:hypothetical protein
MSYGPALSFPSLLKTVMDTHIKKNFEDVPWVCRLFFYSYEMYIYTSIKTATGVPDGSALSLLANHIHKTYIPTPQHLGSKTATQATHVRSSRPARLSSDPLKISHQHPHVLSPYRPIYHIKDGADPLRCPVRLLALSIGEEVV